MTLAFKARTVADPEAQLNFDQLAGMFVTPFSKLNFGTANVTWPGATPFGNTVLVAHGLGVAPAAVVGLASLATGSFPFDLAYVPTSTDATNIGFRAHTTDGSSPASPSTQPFYWLAVG